MQTGDSCFVWRRQWSPSHTVLSQFMTKLSHAPMCGTPHYILKMSLFASSEITNAHTAREFGSQD